MDIFEAIATAPTPKQTEAEKRHAKWLGQLPARVGAFSIDASVAVDDDGNQFPLMMFSGIPVDELEEAIFQQLFDGE